MKLLCIAGQLAMPAKRFGGMILAAAADEWNFMKTSPGDTGVFHSLISKVKDIGASGYELMLTVGVIGLVFSIIFTAVSLLLTSNAQKKGGEEEPGISHMCSWNCNFFGIQHYWFLQVDRYRIINRTGPSGPVFFMEVADVKNRCVSHSGRV